MGRKLIVSCKFGDEFQQGEYGVQYNGGEAFAIEVDEEISFDTFRARVVAKCGLNEEGSLIAMKYYLPTNNTTLISLRDDPDMKIFVNLFKDSLSSDIYVQNLDSGKNGKEHYKVTVLSAVAIDANNQMFPLAFSVVLGETRENWLWFLSNLKIVVDGVAGLTTTSDRHKGLLDTVLEVEEFHKNMNKIKQISLDAIIWLKDSEPYRWAEIYMREDVDLAT
ncbi:hypothetical protein BUALT_Bualt17G0030600 [Buddleja alternifolia]|uniref:MULE transposase domain-containing protein n=1 Tax=Buddleja alternifolia TaxID=168488 RepID=A0AAV6WG81_9LAMI|nr:hypothetical protein BUALT_Bualt17G0030600 [Buddleja alternifolia]